MWILRRPERLSVPHSQETSPFCEPRPYPAGRPLPEDHLPCHYELRERLLSGGERPALARSWAELASVDRFTPRTLADSLTVLLETRSAPDVEERALPTLDPSHGVREDRRSAAHPRGLYRPRSGTPKPGQEGPVDLRVWLCQPRGPRLVLDAHRRHLEAALELLDRAGYAREKLDRLRREPISAGDPYWLYHSSDGGKISAAIPARFASLVLPQLVGKSTRFAEQVLGVYRELDLDDCEDLLLPILRLLVSCPEAQFLETARSVLAVHEREDRRRLAEYLTVAHREVRPTAGISEPPRAIAFEELTALERPNHDAIYWHRLYWYIRHRMRGADRQYLAAGLTLADLYHEARDFTECRSAPGFPLERLLSFTDWVERSSPETLRSSRYSPMTLWAHYGAMPDFVDGFLGILDWRRVGGRAAWSYVYLALDVVYMANDFETARDIGRLVRARLVEFFDTYRAVDPLYRQKLADQIECIHDASPGLPWLAAAWTPLAHLLARSCKAPFCKDNDASNLWIDIALHVDPKQLERLSRLSDDALMRVEETCQRTNDSVLVERGVHTLIRALPSLTLDFLEREPARLLRAAKQLGTFSKPERLRIVDAYTRERVFRVDWQAIGPRGAVRLFEGLLARGLPSPVPKKLRAAAESPERSLTPAQEERAMRTLRSRLDAMRLDLLNIVIEETLGRAYDTAGIGSEERHALRLAQLVEDNRRALRRFLKAWFAGERSFLLEHRRTRDWFRRHPRISRETWLEGIVLEQEVPGHGHVRIEIERHPLRALQLGTHVGSCLGLGGSYAYSAAAVVLDVNKQVLYARDDRGDVVGRQLIAISDDDRLVCFQVYPLGVNKPLRELFRNYDVELARQLGLEIYRSRPDREDYAIEHLIAPQWWDDGAWNFLDELNPKKEQVD